MRQPIHPRLELPHDVIKRTVKRKDELGGLRSARGDAETSASTADDRYYFRARAEEHGRMAAEAKCPAARAAHLELAERYYDRSLEGRLADERLGRREGRSTFPTVRQRRFT